MSWENIKPLGLIRLHFVKRQKTYIKQADVQSLALASEWTLQGVNDSVAVTPPFPGVLVYSDLQYTPKWPDIHFVAVAFLAEHFRSYVVRCSTQGLLPLTIKLNLCGKAKIPCFKRKKGGHNCKEAHLCAKVHSWSMRNYWCKDLGVPHPFLLKPAGCWYTQLTFRVPAIMLSWANYLSWHPCRRWGRCCPVSGLCGSLCCCAGTGYPWAAESCSIGPRALWQPYDACAAPAGTELEKKMILNWGTETVKQQQISSISDGYHVV